MYPLWEKLIKENPSSIEANKQLIRKLLDMIDKSLECFVKDKCSVLFDNAENNFISNLLKHVGSRASIVRRYFDSAKNAEGTIMIPPKYGSLTDLPLYELVFVQIKEDLIINNFDLVATMYGQGYDLTQLSKAALNSCIPGEDGLIRILVGAAFRFNASNYGPPFCASLDSSVKCLLIIFLIYTNI